MKSYDPSGNGVFTEKDRQAPLELIGRGWGLQPSNLCDFYPKFMVPLSKRAIKICVSNTKIINSEMKIIVFLLSIISM